MRFWLLVVHMVVRLFACPWFVIAVQYVDTIALKYENEAGEKQDFDRVAG